mmetsp:Transcript_17296/g.21288  ORF Transcript_17296/g.21288 Transcript_17296/m.21288 type:complete len:125 (-) Transcript_17296:1158-1532(-)
MIPNHNQPIPTATAVPISGTQGKIYTAQPVTQAYAGHPYVQGDAQAQPQVVYAQAVPAQPVEPVRIQVQQQQPRQVQTIVTYERYCGPVTVLMGLILCLFIGPFAIFVVFCPCDEMPRRTVIRQ